MGLGCWIRSVHVLTRRRCDGGRREDAMVLMAICMLYASGFTLQALRFRRQASGFRLPDGAWRSRRASRHLRAPQKASGDRLGYPSLSPSRALRCHPYPTVPTLHIFPVSAPHLNTASRLAGRSRETPTQEGTVSALYRLGHTLILLPPPLHIVLSRYRFHTQILLSPVSLPGITRK